MDHPKRSPEAYIVRVREATQAYLQTVLEESERLRRVVAGLEADKQELTDSVTRLKGEIEARDAARSAMSPPWTQPTADLAWGGFPTPNWRGRPRQGRLAWPPPRSCRVAVTSRDSHDKCNMI